MSTAPPQLDLAYSAARHRASLAEAGDREVLLAVGDGDEQALDELIERKTRPLLQLAYRILGDREEARDVVQVTFFKIWENRGRFDPRWSPNTWIYRIATNLAIDHLRARKSREKHQEPYRMHLSQVGSRQSEKGLAALQQQEVTEIFQRLAAELTEKQRLAFLLREVEGLSSAEVAEILSCQESTVRNHVFNARKALQARLREEYPEYAEPAAGSPS
jgi:RNA polymerase sigma-70 factor (ECF subfamily)